MTNCLSGPSASTATSANRSRDDGDAPTRVATLVF